jgi:hypothetical protein
VLTDCAAPTDNTGNANNEIWAMDFVPKLRVLTTVEPRFNFRDAMW